MKKLLVVLLLSGLTFICCLSLVVPAALAVEPPPITDDTFKMFNPLKATDSQLGDSLSTPGGIISRMLIFAFPLAGVILFVMIVWGGFEILAGSATKKSVDAGKQRITAAVIGFILLFVSYWIIQIIEVVFGVKIFLGT